MCGFLKIEVSCLVIREGDFMKAYEDNLAEQFKHNTIILKHFDNGNTQQCMQFKIVVKGLTKAQLKDKGTLVLDLGNYIYRKFGLQYEMCPEFNNAQEEKNSVTWFISKERANRHRHIFVRYGIKFLKDPEHCYAFDFNPIVIQKGE